MGPPVLNNRRRADRCVVTHIIRKRLFFYVRSVGRYEQLVRQSPVHKLLETILGWKKLFLLLNEFKNQGCDIVGLVFLWEVTEDRNIYVLKFTPKQFPHIMIPLLPSHNPLKTCKYFWSSKPGFSLDREGSAKLSTEGKYKLKFGSNIYRIVNFSNNSVCIY